MDPLRPFSDLIRTLWKSSATPVERTQGQSEARPVDLKPSTDTLPAAESGYLSLRMEMRTRIRQIGLGDPQRVREVFVETVIARELGLSATHAADLAEIVQQVATRMGSHPALSERLHALLTALAEEPAG